MSADWLMRGDRAGHALWLGLALAFGAYNAAFGLIEAFAGPFVVQDDVRQHVFWMLRFIDPDLFPDDPAADYFKSVAPVGFVWLYRVLTSVGLDPITVSRLLPLPITLLYAAAAYGVGFAIARKPLAGFLVAWVAVQNVWLVPDLSSATPRAFLYPFFMAFLAFAMLRRPYWAAAAVLSTGLFYPAYAIVAGGVAALLAIEWRGRRLSLAENRDRLRTGILCFVASISVLGLYALQTGAYGPVISYAEAQALPEFWEGGRSQFFDSDGVRFWSCGIRSGLLSPEWCQLRNSYWGPFPATIVLIPIFVGIITLPLLHRDRFTGALFILPHVIAVGFGLFVVSHLVLFDLHLPARYTHHSFRMVFDISLGLLLFLGAVSLLQRLGSPVLRKGLSTRMWSAVFVLFIALFPLVVGATGYRGYVAGKAPRIYEFLQQAPKDATVASLEKELSNIPSFARRSAIGALEHSIPYHLGYYRPFRQRVEAIAEGQYTDDPGVLADVIDRLSPTFWLLSDNSYNTFSVAESWWAPQFPDIAASAEGIRPVLAELGEACEVLRDGAFQLIEVACIRKYLGPP